MFWERFRRKGVFWGKWMIAFTNEKKEDCFSGGGFYIERGLSIKGRPVKSNVKKLLEKIGAWGV